MTAQEIFFDVKKKVEQLIRENKHREVTRFTNHKEPGIYMLFIDDFSDNKILPFYIGQTDNFQRRHYEHLSEVMAINRLTYDYFENYLINNYYDGQYKAVKMFNYLLSHELTLDRVRMVILEQIEEKDIRDKKEIEYINRLYAPYIGFNQYNTISGYVKLTLENERKEYYLLHNRKRKLKDETPIWESLERKRKHFITETLGEELINIKLLFDYGYNLFNCNLIKGTIKSYFPQEYEDIFINVKIDELNSLMERSKNYEHERIIQYSLITKAEKSIKTVIEQYVNDYFEANGLRNKKNKEKLIDYYLYDKKDRPVDVEKYIKQYSKGDKNFFNKIAGEDEIWNKIEKERNIIQEQSIVANQLKEEHSKCIRKIFELRGLHLEKYVPYPLKDLYQEHIFANNTINTCNILVDYTSDRANYNIDTYPAVMRVATKVIDTTGTIIEKEWFVENSLSDFFENNDKKYYVRRSFFSVHKPDPFNLSISGADTKISLKAEYDTGINEYTLSKYKSVTLSEVYDELESLIDDNMELKIIIPRSKRRFIDRIESIKNERLKIKLKKASKKKAT